MKRLAWLFVLILAGCALFAKPQPPAVSLAGIDVESFGLFEQRFVLKLRLKNPNNFDIPIEGLDFDVEVNGKPFANGVSNMGVTLPGLGEVVLEVKASSNLAAFLRQWRDQEKGGRSGIDYRVKGKVQVAGRGPLPFDHRGEAPFPKFLKMPEEKPKPVPGSV